MYFNKENNVIKINNNISLENEIIPILKDQLQNLGFSLLSYNNNNQDELELERNLLSIILLLGRSIASAAGYLILKGNDESKSLEIHNECIYLPSNVISYFALGCIKPSTTGGNTRIFDGRKAAIII